MKKTNYLLAILSVVTWLYFFSNYGYRNEIFSGDSLGYYSYLPAAFIYNNLTQMETSGNDKILPEKIKHYVTHGPYDNPKTPLNKYLVQYTIGVAVMEMPFFLIAHFYSKWMGYPADGLAPLYQLWIKISNILYLLLGLVLIYHSLKKFYHTEIALCISLLLLIGSNLLFFTSFHFGMSHIPLFFLYALVIYLTIRFHEVPRYSKAFLLGIAIGFVVLIRATDILIVLIPVLYKVYDIDSLKEKIKFIKSQYQKLILGIVISVVPVIPQLIYWKIMSGSFFYYSYGNQKLDLSNPHIIDGWFGSDNGWLHYSPIMILSLFGLFLFKKDKYFGILSLLYFFLYSYFIYSWFCYQYVNGFGSRPMINIYPLLAFPFAAFIYWIQSKRWIFKFLIAGFIGFTTYVNLAFTYKQLNGQLWSEYSSFTYNASTLFKFNLDKKDIVTMDIPYIQPRDLKDYREIRLASNSFESDSHSVYDEMLKSKVFYMTNSEYSTEVTSYVFDKKKVKNKGYFKISGKFLIENSPFYYYGLSEIAFNIKREDKSIFNKACKIDNKLRANSDTTSINLFEIKLNQWGEVEFYIPYPLHRELIDGDIMEIYINNSSKSNIRMDDISIDYLTKE